MKTSAIIAVIGAVLMTGCAPLWPSVDPISARIYRNGTPTFNDYPEPQTSEASTDLLKRVRTFATDSRNEFSQQAGFIEQTKNGEILGLTGIGLAAAWNVVDKGSKGPLQSLTFAAAALLGVDVALSAESQHKIFLAGTKSVQCTLDVDDALSRAPVSMMQSAMRGGSSRLTLTESGTFDSAAAAGIKKEIADERSKAWATLGGTSSIEDKIDAYNTVRLSDQLDVAYAALERAMVTLAVATNETTRAENLRTAVFKIRVSVAEQLHNSRDATKIFGTMRDSLSKPPPQDPTPATMNALGAMDTLNALPSVKSTELANIRALLNLTSAVLQQLTAAVAKALDDCVGETIVKKPTT